ncbi:MAG TPA: hypothetical protein VF646_04355, partial [Cytophagales bacterium]
MKRTGWLLLLGLAASSCNQKTDDHTTSAGDTLAVESPAAPPKRTDRAAGIIARTPLLEPAYKDTVCWENCGTAYPVGSQDLLEAMAL